MRPRFVSARAAISRVFAPSKPRSAKTSNAASRIRSRVASPTALGCRFFRVAMVSLFTHLTNFVESPIFTRMSNLNAVAIAALDAALTFARVDAEHPTVLAVRSWQDGRIEAVDLGAGDPISLYEEHGYDALRDKIATAPAASRVTLSAADLVQPVDLGSHHVAVGTNYPAHAGEADVEGGPFLFPKLVEPTGPYSPVPAGNGLLDFEVELAFVLLEDLEPGRASGAVGLVLANELTDRETLLRHVDPWNPTSGAGFTTGKSFPGFLPVGALFVVPRDVRTFV